MKQVDKVSIGGYAFTLESEAAQAVHSYLEQLGDYYKSSEVMEGIEERMAELLLEKTPAEGVVDLGTVNGIIEILGRPERIEAEEPKKEEAAAPPKDKPRKKLYRDMERAKVAGVCSGLSSYFGVDVAIFRLCFLVLTILGLLGCLSIGGTGFSLSLSLTAPFIYLLLWIAMPAARTARQRWELRGEDGSAESIRRNVQDHGRVGDALCDVGNSPAWGTIGRILEVCVGLVLLIIAVSGLFAGALAAFGWEWLGLSGQVSEAITSITEEYPQFPGIVSMRWVQILAIVVYALPFIGMLYASVLLLFRFKSPSWHPGLWIFVIWLIAVIALVILVLACLFSATTIV
ncbi:MAG: PspC domain-containing protein [Bacteroidales bacterium]|nr:PspC domain-containing protein [Bacteroidales bacterium]